MANKRQDKRQENSLFDRFTMSPLGSQSPMRQPADRGEAPDSKRGIVHLPGMAPTFEELAAGASLKRDRKRQAPAADPADLGPLFSGEAGADLE